MKGRQPNSPGICPFFLQQGAPRMIKLLQRFLRHRHELHARLGQPRRIGGAIDQRRAYPGFKLLDTPAKGGLRDMSLLRRFREIERSGQRQEILEPFDFHGSHSQQKYLPGYSEASLLGAMRRE
ncbi:hypothetical protein D3C72_1147560 [compost metagenome]